MKKVILLLFCILSSCWQEKKPIELNMANNNQEVYKVSLVAVGDNLIHNTIYESSKVKDTFDFTPIFRNVKPYIRQHDLAFINQETILGGSTLGLSSYPRFNSPQEMGEALIDCGFNLISLANNHTLDRGEEAVNNSVKFWQSKDVVYSGSEISNVSHVKYFTKNNINFAFVAYTYGTNGIPIPSNKEYLVNLFTYEKAEKELKEARRKADVVIVSMHWGNEYVETPSETQVEQAKFLADLGVDLIIGHHPHVIQPFAIINDKTHVVYSLGNFLSDQSGIDRLIGMAFSVEIEKKMENDNTIIKILSPKAKLFYTYSNNHQNFQNIFFSDINEKILPNYREYFKQKKAIIRKYTNIIEVS